MSEVILHYFGSSDSVSMKLNFSVAWKGQGLTLNLEWMDPVRRLFGLFCGILLAKDGESGISAVLWEGVGK